MREIKLHHTRVFKSLWYNKPNRIRAFRGGARSSKTWSILQAISFWLITGKFGNQTLMKGNFSVVRDTLPSLRASAYKDFISILHDVGMYYKMEHRKTSLEFHFQGREVAFFSTDDLNSSKLRGRQHSGFYMNEANLCGLMSFHELLMRTGILGAILDYNPQGSGSWCQTYIEGDRFDRGEVNLDVSTYHDNIDHIPKEMVDEIENLKYTDEDLYSVYAKGSWVKSRNLVFQEIHEIDTMPTEYDSQYYGIDWGYIDPTSCIRVLKAGNNLYIESVIYQTKLMLDQVADLLHAYGVGKIYGDHEPRTIREMKTKGVRIKPAKKGKDSIRQGLGYIRQHKIHVLKTSTDVLREFRGYKYVLDKELNPTEVPEGGKDHSIDATRYALSYALRGGLIIN